MKTYLWPKVLGGGEHEEYRHVTGVTESPLGTVAFLVDGKLVCIAVSLLTEVNPQPEPGFYALTYKNGSRIVAEREGEDWYIAGANGSVPWGAVRPNLASTTHLVPAPEPIELPWGHTDREHCEVDVNESPRPWAACRVGVEGSGVDLTPEAAETMARALWTAAARHWEATS